MAGLRRWVVPLRAVGGELELQVCVREIFGPSGEEVLDLRQVHRALGACRLITECTVAICDQPVEAFGLGNVVCADKSSDRAGVYEKWPTHGWADRVARGSGMASLRSAVSR